MNPTKSGDERAQHSLRHWVHRTHTSTVQVTTVSMRKGRVTLISPRVLRNSQHPSLLERTSTLSLLPAQCLWTLSWERHRYAIFAQHKTTGLTRGGSHLRWNKYHIHLDCCCCCFSHSAHWLPTRKKLLYTAANPARGLLNREKKKKKKSGSAPPPPPPPPPPRARCSFGENKNNKNKTITRRIHIFIGATQVGVTQVVSVRLASVQGFLRLVS